MYGSTHQISKAMSGIWNFILVVIAVFLPPLAVFFKHGLHHQFWVNILLTFLGYIPGVIHAWYEVLRTPQYYYIPPRYAAAAPVGNVGGAGMPAGRAYGQNAGGVAPVNHGHHQGGFAQNTVAPVGQTYGQQNQSGQTAMPSAGHTMPGTQCNEPRL